MSTFILSEISEEAPYHPGYEGASVSDIVKASQNATTGEIGRAHV